MYNLVMLLGLIGYGVGFEGYSDGKLYVGAYTPNAEYGWIVTPNSVYLDTIFVKRS